MRAVIVAIVMGVLVGCAGSEGSGGTGGKRMSYSEAVRQIGRPPTASKRSADGSLDATWETEVSGGTRRLVMRFDRDQRLVSSETLTVPAKR